MQQEIECVDPQCPDGPSFHRHRYVAHPETTAAAFAALLDNYDRSLKKAIDALEEIHLRADRMIKQGVAVFESVEHIDTVARGVLHGFDWSQYRRPGQESVDAASPNPAP